MMQLADTEHGESTQWVLHFLTWPFTELKFGLRPDSSQTVKSFRCDIC